MRKVGAKKDQYWGRGIPEPSQWNSVEALQGPGQVAENQLCGKGVGTPWHLARDFWPFSAILNHSVYSPQIATLESQPDISRDRDVFKNLRLMRCSALSKGSVKLCYL